MFLKCSHASIHGRGMFFYGRVCTLKCINALMAAKGDGGNSLFQPLKEGLSLSKPSKPSLNLEHLSKLPATLAKRKRSRDSTDELPDYIDDDSEDDSASLPIAKRSPTSKKSPSVPSSRSNTTPTTTNPNIKPGTVSLCLILPINLCLFLLQVLLLLSQLLQEFCL